MNDERRYDEDEVRRIFTLATDEEASGAAEPGLPAEPSTSTGRGMTLAELEEIGQEVGIAPALVARAARALDAPAEGQVRPARGAGALQSTGVELQRIMGLPVGVEHQVHLERNLTDDEWAQLVMDVRRRFGAPGRLESAGAFREWRNGNLHVSLAASGDGAVLSMGTRKGNAGPLAGVAGFFLTFATVLLVVMVLTGEIAEAGAIVAPAIIGSMALGALGVNVLRLPPWARRRAAQMEGIGELAQELAARPPAGGGELPPDSTAF
jgi:hypothetical protein